MQRTEARVFVSHPMPEHADKLNSSVRIKLKHPFPAAINHAGRIEIQVSLVFKPAVDSIIDDCVLPSLVRKIFSVFSGL